MNARHNGRVTPDPAVISNSDTPGILDAISTRLHARLVGSSKDGDKGAKLDAVADFDDATV